MFPNTHANDRKPYVSLARKGRQGGGRRQIYHLESLVFRQVVLPGKKFGRLSDRSGRTFPRLSENHENRCGRTLVERLATRSSRRGNHALFGQIRDPARWLEESDRGKRPPHHRSRSRRVQLREDRHRLTENWQEERVRLLKLLEDQTCTVKLLTDERRTLVAKARRTFWQRVFRRKPTMAA